MKSKAMLMPSKSQNRNLKRGDIYYADLSGIEQSVGSEQTGRRPVLVIQNDIGNLYSPTTIIAILTSKVKKDLPTHVVIRNFSGLSEVSAVCLEQIKTIDKSRLQDYRGNIGNEVMKEIEQAISISLGTPKGTMYEMKLITDYMGEEVCDMNLVRRDTEFDGKINDWLYWAEQQFRFFADVLRWIYVKKHKGNLSPANINVLNGLFKDGIHKLKIGNTDWSAFNIQTIRASLIVNMYDAGCSLEEISYLSGAPISGMLQPDIINDDMIKKAGERSWKNGAKCG